MAGVAGVKPATLKFTHSSNSTNTSYVFGTNVTFPSTLTIEVEPGALISIPVAAAHITIGKMADPGAKQVFNDPNGMVTFGAGAVIKIRQNLTLQQTNILNSSVKRVSGI
jgi:hypothetical protein